MDPQKVKRRTRFVLKLWAAAAVVYFSYVYLIPQTFNYKGKIDDCCCEAELVQNTNQKIYQKLDELSHTKFFRTFKVNIDTECKFFSVEGICKSQGCSVCRCDENNIPLPWKKTDFIQQSKYDYADWAQEPEVKITDEWQWRVEEFNESEGSYVDLKDNVEAFTGYQGQNIWKLIYEENCFQGEDLCLEQRALNRILSGLHASVSTQLSELYIDFNKNRTKMYPNWKLYFEKVGNYPERIHNLYFYYSVLLRAINRAESVIRNYNFTTGDFQEDAKTYQLVGDILDYTTSQCDQPFHEEILFNTDQGRKYKKHYQQYIHNITKIMDCVECEKCKVFGKMQVYGIGVALKILFSDDSSTQIQKLQRNELITLINAFVKCASSLDVVDKMFYRRFKSYFNIGLALFSSSLFFMGFLYFAMEIQEKYLGQKIKKMFQHFPTNIPDPNKKKQAAIAQQQELARKQIFGEGKAKDD
ncbi:endoplasmic reticulum oxidoreductin 1 (macronuclear) [Tetrahymena thermophila SB210]|uniref:Endoplasmic reticulum oxidoreductin 1 n=1 Tax=Tetrahymena thermophila (strain SB210) TaxID=312017 RepID=Q24DE0_TETTS|nr:endoplasmic reticulum oxidoreductin 1 [Tetrahymena thermophila SB210]EAS05801.2 endoplasmic reticulum oxidoreductin 1 [Tetrahymena thermophila SB210]|eukprot:XP_001026046.2 endoplasmic reticulum oxidoreductin 1 [Tetrahymena thermophila SB210]